MKEFLEPVIKGISAAARRQMDVPNGDIVMVVAIAYLAECILEGLIRIADALREHK